MENRARAGSLADGESLLLYDNDHKSAKESVVSVLNGQSFPSQSMWVRPTRNYHVE